MPHQPVRWEADHATASGDARCRSARCKQAAVIQLIHAFRVRGHLIADLNPLGPERGDHPELDPATYGLTIWDLDREFLMRHAEVRRREQRCDAARDSGNVCAQTYCGKIGCEYMHIQIPEQKELAAGAHGADREPVAAGRPATRLRALERVVEAEEFEHFLHHAFRRAQAIFARRRRSRRSRILDEMLERAANTNVHEAVIGMAHRGRLNVLANIVGKSMVQVFSEFEGNVDPFSAQGSGDVKYHLGASGVRKLDTGNEITVSVAFNPSHLEAVDPVVEGHRAAEAGSHGRHEARTRDPDPDPRRRGIRGTGRGCGDAESFATGRLHHRRHDSPGDQ